MLSLFTLFSFVFFSGIAASLVWSFKALPFVCKAMSSKGSPFRLRARRRQKAALSSIRARA